MTEAEIKDAMKTANPFKYLNVAELEMLISHSKIISFKSGDTILQQGKKSIGLYVIINGHAFVTTKTLGKDVLTLLTIEHGNFVGEIGTLEKGVYATTVIANSELQTLLIPNEYFDMLSIFFPETKYKISKSITEEICNRIKIIHDRIVKYMAEANMIQTSLYEDFMKSFTSKKTISFNDASIEPQQLRNTDFFKVFSDKEFTILLEHSDLVMTPQNYTIRKEGEIRPPCYIILRGAVQTSMTQSDKTAKLSVLGPICLFGSISVIDGSASLINYTTREKTILLEITQAHLDKIQSMHEVLWFKLYELICQSFVKLERVSNRLDARLHSELYNR